MRGHLAERERAVVAAQRAHSETVEHAVVGKVPVAPCQKAGEIGLEIVGAEAIPAEDRITAQQNPAVPELRLLYLLQRKMDVDVGAALNRERPRPPTAFQIELCDAMNGDRH